MPAACQSFLSHPSTFAFSGLEGAKQQRLCRPSGNPVGVNLAGVSLFRMRAHGWRWGLWRAFGMADAARFCSGPLRPPNPCLLPAKASCFTHPPLLLAKKQRLCRRSGYPLAGVSLFRMRADRWRWGLLGFSCFGWALAVARRCVRPSCRQIPPLAPQAKPLWFCFRSRHTSLPYPLSRWACFSIRLLVFARPSGNPVGLNLAGVSLFRMRAPWWRWGLWRAFGIADAARFCSGPLRPPNQCLLPAKASCFTHPPLFLAGSKVPRSSGSADPVATRWAWILPGFPCFGCVLTADAGGCWGFPVSDACLPQRAVAFGHHVGRSHPRQSLAILCFFHDTLCFFVFLFLSSCICRLRQTLQVEVMDALIYDDCSDTV